MSCTGRPTKSVRSTSSGTRLIPMVEHEVVAVRVAEERHVADPGVERVAEEFDAGRLELPSRLGDIGYVQREVAVVLRCELPPHALRLPDPAAGVADPELVLRFRIRAQAERFHVERPRTLRVAG